MAVDNPSYFSVSGPSGSNSTTSGSTSRGLGNIFKRRRHVNKMGGGSSSTSIGSTPINTNMIQISGKSAPSTPTEEMMPMLVRGNSQPSCTRRSFRSLFRSTSANSNDENMRQFLKGFPRPSDVAPPSPYLPHRSHSHSEKDRKQPERRRVLKSTSELLNTDSAESNDDSLGMCVVDGHRYTNIDDDDDIEDQSQSMNEIRLTNKDVRYYNLSSTLPDRRRRHSIGTFLGKERSGSSENAMLRCDPKEILGEVPPIPIDKAERSFQKSRRKTAKAGYSCNTMPTSYDSIAISHERYPHSCSNQTIRQLDSETISMPIARREQ